MASLSTTQTTAGEKFVANLLRFYQWLAAPHVILSLIMLLIIFYMLVTPLYRMVKFI